MKPVALVILGGRVGRVCHWGTLRNEGKPVVCPSQRSDFAQAERGSRNADERHLHAMIHAYLDDSGDSRYAVCGGILGAAEYMTFTEAFWATETKDLEQPFRSTECECQQGQFKSWKKSECNALMSRLVGILNNPYIRAGLIGTAVPIDLFRQVFPNPHKDDPMRLAIRHVIIGLVKMARRTEDRTRLWFEGGPTDADALRAYNDVRDYKFPNALEQNRLAGIAFHDKTLAPLQAADLVARECFKAASNRGKRPIRKPLERMWLHTGMVELSEGCLRRLKEAGSSTDIRAIEVMDCRMGIVETTPYSQKIESI